MDSLNAVDQYGNTSRLRGYDSAIGGRKTAVVNLEYRSPALELATEQVGLVVAGAQPLDAADAHGFQSRSAVGAGIRVVTPLLERAGSGSTLRFRSSEPRSPARQRPTAWISPSPSGKRSTSRT
jgi:hypothetical protein